MKNLLQKKSIILLTIILLIGIVSFIKFPKSLDINYYNSDATWHTLLTITAYDKTPISIHKFAPIVSLGGTDNKHVPWGLTIPDKEGNYYYTSFSAATFFIPYLFMKIFHLPINEISLYIFNTILFILSAYIWLLILKKIFKDSKFLNTTLFIGFLTYVFSPELLHGMGIVFWAQSIMQVTILLQLYFFLNRKDKKIYKYLFYIFCIINPYIEWTGFIANIGFMITNFIEEFKINKKTTFVETANILSLTILSSILFCLHFLTTSISPSDFIFAIITRFLSRNVTTKISIYKLFKGYISSFSFLWILLILLFITNIITFKNINWVKNTHAYRNKTLIIILFFLIVENIIMKQHAVAYSYDRMKFVFLLVFLICDWINLLLNKKETKKILVYIIVLLTFFCSLSNLIQYTNNNKYLWSAPFRTSNKILAEHININYENSILSSQEATIRGYNNLIFNKSIYEKISLTETIKIAKTKNKQFAILLLSKGDERLNMSNFTGAYIYNLHSKNLIKIELKNNSIQEIPINYTEGDKDYDL